MITIQIFPDAHTLSDFAAQLFADKVRDSVLVRGRFMVALSGGGTPVALYRILAQSPYRESIPWDKMDFFWGDERCVPPDDSENCYNQAYRAWLSHVPVSEKNIHRILGELGPDPAAEDYAKQLKGFADNGHIWPRFDLVLLGLGADGHTASLFPGSSQLSGVPTLAVNANYQDRPAKRVSLTPDVINSAINVVFLAVGVEKASALANTICGARNSSKFPAQRIQPVNGNLWWLVDAAAASLLPDCIDGVTIQR